MDKKQIALNHWFLFLILVGFFVLSVAVMFAFISEKGLFILGIVASVVSFVCAFLEPCLYSFDEQSINIHFVFDRKERYLLKNIKSISEGYDNIFHRWHLFVPSKSVYRIDGKAESEVKWYMKGSVRKSRRVKSLVKKYWGEIKTL